MTKKSGKILLVILFSAITISAYASNQQDLNYYTLTDISANVIGIEESDEKIPPHLSLNQNTKSPASAGTIINTGVTMWNVINNGVPSGAASSAYASAVPGGFFSWPHFVEWKGPKKIYYEFKVKNLYRMTVIYAKYVISFYYGGIDKRGEYKGNYIANFTIKPLEVKILKGFNLSLQVRMSDPMNIGTKENPVAYLQSDLNWMISSPLKAEGGTWVYGVDGNGNFTDLSEVSKEISKNFTDGHSPFEFHKETVSSHPFQITRPVKNHTMVGETFTPIIQGQPLEYKFKIDPENFKVRWD